MRSHESRGDPRSQGDSQVGEIPTQGKFVEPKESQNLGEVTDPGAQEILKFHGTKIMKKKP